MVPSLWQHPGPITVASDSSHIDPRDPLADDRRPISKRIREAKQALARRAASEMRDKATAWLDRASVAIERRNAALHATPIVWIDDERRCAFGLGELRRADRPYFGRPLTVESMSELRSVLDKAAEGWNDLVVAFGTESMRQVPLDS